MRFRFLQFIPIFCLFAAALPQNSVAAEPVSLNESLRRVVKYSLQSRTGKGGDLKKAASGESWNWTSGVLMFGLSQVCRKTGDTDALDFLRYWIEDHYEKGLHIWHPDRIMPAATVSEMLLNGQSGGNRAKYDSILVWSYRFLHARIPVFPGCRDENGHRQAIALQWRGRAWLDDLYMSGMFMTRYSQLHPNSGIENAISAQFQAHFDLLQCHGRDSRLLKHGQYFTRGGRRYLPAGRVAWARGNGWFLAALADFMTHIEVNGQGPGVLLPRFLEVMEELPALQKENGLFPTVLDRSGAYGEVSATALFLYATATSLKNGWLKEDRFYGLLRRGLTGVLAKVSPAGKISGVSAGTNVMPLPLLYRMVPGGSHPWGEGTVMLALLAAIDLWEKEAMAVRSPSGTAVEKDRFLDEFSL